jgi:hypothetical protein
VTEVELAISQEDGHLEKGQDKTFQVDGNVPYLLLVVETCNYANIKCYWVTLRIVHLTK